jgi:hypothetical protein
MDFNNVNSVNEVLVKVDILNVVNDAVTNMDNMENIIVIYIDKNNRINLDTAGFENDYMAIGMMEDCKNMILNDKLLEDDDKEQ